MGTNRFPFSLRIIFLVAIVCSTSFILPGDTLAEIDGTKCNPTMRTYVRTTSGGSVSSVKAGGTYRLDLEAYSGTIPGNMTIHGWLSNISRLVPNSFSAQPTQNIDNYEITWRATNTTFATFSLQFKLWNAYELSHVNTPITFSTPWSNFPSCFGSYVTSISSLPIEPFLSATAETGDADAKVNQTYDIPITMGAAKNLPVTNVVPDGPLKITVIDGDADLAECNPSPTPATIPQLGGSFPSEHSFTYKCKAKKKGKLRLTFPGASGLDSDGRTVRTEAELQSGVFTITAGLQVDFEFDKASLPADGAGREFSIGTVTVKDTNGNAVDDQLVNLDGPVWRMSQTGSPPRLILCDESNRRVYPSSENKFPRSFSRYTHSGGKFTFTLYPGTDTGPSGGSAPGLGLGNLFMDAALPEDDISEDTEGHKSTTIDLKGTPQTTLGNIKLTLQAHSRDGTTQGKKLGMLSAIVSKGPLPSIQRTVLNWLLALRYAGILTADFGPIRTANGSAGILFYPRNNPGPVVAYLSGGASLPADYETAVVPFNKILLLNEYSPKFDDDVVSLDNWEKGIPPNLGTGDVGYQKPRGRATAGIVAEGDLGYQYFGYPYPPSPTQAFANATRSKCLNPIPSQIFLGVHSPVRVIATDSNKRRAGVLPNGKLISDIPESVVLVPTSVSEMTGVILPVADFQVSIVGTGSGPALVSVLSPASEGSDLSIFSFESKKGISGRFSINPAGTSKTMTIGGKQVRATHALGFRISGLPKDSKVKRNATLKLFVKDQFGNSVRGATVKVTSSVYSLSRTTLSNGGMSVPTKAMKKSKKFTLSFSAPGFASMKKTLIFK